MTEVQNGRVAEAWACTDAAHRNARHDARRRRRAAYGHRAGAGRSAGEAARLFGEAARLACQDHPYQCVYLRLLLSDAQRRAGDVAAAEASWCEAVRQAGDLATAKVSVTDPILWERIAYLRGANTPWPVEIRQRLTDQCVRYGIVLPAPPAQVSPVEPPTPLGEAALWTCIGQWRLARQEGQAALVALKRAESMISQEQTAAQLRLAQTKALVRLGQTSAASAVLIALAADSQPQVSHAALAMLGAMKLQQGSPQQGFNLLHRAVEENLGLIWPERAQAEADLGLAYLMCGDEAAGLRWLHTAQQSLEAAGHAEQLTQCLENEAAYLEQTKKKDLARAVRTRLTTLQ